MKQEEWNTAAGQGNTEPGLSPSDRLQKDMELILTNERMQDIINALPGGVAIYRVSEIFEAMYFSNGVAALAGYSVQEYRELTGHNAIQVIYPDDREMVVSRIGQALNSHTTADFDYRKLHREGYIIWVHVRAKQIGEEYGLPLLQCVFHDVTALKETRFEMEHLINSIPGGIASYKIEEGRFIPTYFSDGVLGLSGHTRQEFEELIKDDALDIIYEADRERVLSAAMDAVLSGEMLDVSYRMRHKNGNLIWIHLNGRRMGPLAETMRFYAVFTGMSAETRLYQSIADESADGIYVIAKKSYELLYINDSKGALTKSGEYLGQKCYAALHKKDAPCACCPLREDLDGESHELAFPEEGRILAAHCRETNWNGVAAYIQYVQDVTEAVRIRQEKERLEQYFQTIVKNIPSGISVVRCEADGALIPEYISEGLAALLHVPVERIYEQYRQDIVGGVHPDDASSIRKELKQLLQEGSGRRELICRIQSGEGGYVWIRASVSLLPASGDARRLYTSYTDITKAVKEKEQLRQQYDDMILKHYHTPDPNTLLVAHSNITENRMLRVIDYSGDDLLNAFGSDREIFFTKIAGQIEDKEERRRFLGLFLRAPILAAFKRQETECVMECFAQRLRVRQGVYMEFKLGLLEAPDSGDITGILTVTDITERVISRRVLQQLSVIGYDLVVDLDLIHDSYRVLSSSDQTCCIPTTKGSHSYWMTYMLQNKVVPRDREQYRNGLEAENIARRLRQEGAYTFAFSVMDDNGDTRTKNMTVSAIDLRLGRVCLSRADITDSVREQQGLLNVVAYTFEVAGFINPGSGRVTLYTRRTVLENLPPYIVNDYNSSRDEMFASYYMSEEKSALDLDRQFDLDYITQRLKECPSGYDFVLPYREEDSVRYKQINVMWGDQYCKTICMVWADVTDILLTERETQRAMEEALESAEEANRAKSNFLSSMSHDIRTPMNAIIGMTTLALAHLDDPTRISDCLKKISISSKHLLSLVNDVLDMNKIERSQITLNPVRISLPKFLEQLCAIIGSQARSAGLELHMQTARVKHTKFYGDSLRLNQIMLNLLSNAVKFTPGGGKIELSVEEIAPRVCGENICYRITVRDTGIGMPPEFLDRVFLPFARGMRAAYTEGTGLGLSITKGLVDVMGGRITVESTENQGTAFYVELEFEAVKDDGGREDETADGDCVDSVLGKYFTGRRFLIAEDNAINAEILSELLAMRGGSSIVVINGSQAVEAFQAAPPDTYDAILMDIQMPEMNGYEAARAIRSLSRDDAAKIPIVAMTANAFAEDIRGALDAGMNAHVAKPVDMGLLTTVLTRIFREAR